MEIRKGEFVYEIGDHGAIIVMADSQKKTDKLLYSWNEGLTWNELTMDLPFEVENIVIEPSSVSQRFLVHGRTDSKGVTFSVDFSNYYEPICKNPDKAGNVNSDYELWIPHNAISNSCLMGRKIEYVRRKQYAECFNGIEFERPKFIENCVCTRYDFECDLGFYADKTEKCVKIPGYDSEDNECDENDVVKVSKGYRKVAGNTCYGGVSYNYEPTVLPCSNTFGKNAFAIMAVVVICIIVVFLKQHGQGVVEYVKSWNPEYISKKGCIAIVYSKR